MIPGQADADGEEEDEEEEEGMGFDLFGEGWCFIVICCTVVRLGILC